MRFLPRGANAQAAIRRMIHSGRSSNLGDMEFDLDTSDDPFV